MAKKKSQDETPISEPAIARLYTVGEWSGQPQYKCTLCPFDSMRLDGILTHIQDVHLPKIEEPIRKPSGILVADKHGNAVKPDETGLIGVYEIDLKEVTKHGTNDTDQDNG